MLSAIVFDFDGVIADSEPVHYRSFRDVLAEEGVDLSERDYYQKYLGFSDAGAFRAIGADRARPWTADQLAALASRKAIRYEALARDHAALFPGADAAVRRAAQAVPLALRLPTCSTAPISRGVLQPSSPPATRRRASRRPIPICERWRSCRRRVT